MARFTTGLPFRGPSDGCRGCGSSPNATHLNDCWVMETLDWAYKNGQNDGRSTTPAASTDDELTAWWVRLARAEAEKVVPKAIEYGSNSLVDVGHQMARQAGRTVTDPQAEELAIYFYIVGKMGRWADSLVAGRQVSDDTLHDIGVYARMAQRIRSHGGWPAVDLKENP